MDVLVSVYVCARDAGSEPEIGYTSVLAAVRAGHRVTVLTSADRDLLAAQLELDGVVADIISLPGPVRLDRHIGRMGLGHLHYLLWQAKAAKLLRTLDGGPDVAHHVTFGADWMPAAVHVLRQSAVVWGPVGGFAPLPWRLVRYLPRRSLLQEGARLMVTGAARRLTACAARRSGALVVAHNPDTSRWFATHGFPVVTRPLVAMPPVSEGPLGGSPAREVGGAPGSRRAVFVGRLTGWKGCFLAVATLAHLPEEWHLDVFGSGDVGPAMAAEAERLGVAARLHLLGQQPKPAVWSALENADVLLLPTMHDSAPQPVAQALRSGCPVVCLDIAGPPGLMDGRGTALRPGAHLAARMAAAVTASQRFEPDDRWSAARLPAVVDGLYRQAVRLRGA